MWMLRGLIILLIVWLVLTPIKEIDFKLIFGFDGWFSFQDRKSNRQAFLKLNHPFKNNYIMKNWFLNIALFLSAWTVQAHQTEISSTMLVEQDNNTWVLQIRSALTAFDQIIKTNYPPYENVEAFQSLVIKHLQDNLEISCNNQDIITLQNGAVKLGHESSVVFEVIGIPENIESMHVKNSSFNSIHRSQSALIILKKGFDKKQFILNRQNNYELELLANNNQFITANAVIATSKVSSNYSYSGLAMVMIGLLLISLLWVKSNRPQLSNTN